MLLPQTQSDTGLPLLDVVANPISQIEDIAMAPPPPTEDYYRVLQVSQAATSDQITKSYKRLALELHPDRNATAGATQAFQLVGPDSPLLRVLYKSRSRLRRMLTEARHSLGLLMKHSKTPRSAKNTTSSTPPSPAQAQVSQSMQTRDRVMIQRLAQRQHRSPSFAGTKQSAPRNGQSCGRRSSRLLRSCREKFGA